MHRRSRATRNAACLNRMSSNVGFGDLRDAVALTDMTTTDRGYLEEANHPNRILTAITVV